MLCSLTNDEEILALYIDVLEKTQSISNDRFKLAFQNELEQFPSVKELDFESYKIKASSYAFIFIN